MRANRWADYATDGVSPCGLADVTSLRLCKSDGRARSGVAALARSLTGFTIDMEDAFRGLTNFVRDHQQWAAPVVFALAFAESLAFLSLIIPAWGALVAIGALMGAAGGSFWPMWVAGALGAAFGDWLSYWIGTRFHDRIGGWWPMSKYPGHAATR